MVSKSASNYSSDFNLNSTGNFIVLMKIYQYPNISDMMGIIQLLFKKHQHGAHQLE